MLQENLVSETDSVNEMSPKDAVDTRDNVSDALKIANPWENKRLHPAVKALLIAWADACDAEDFQTKCILAGTACWVLKSAPRVIPERPWENAPELDLPSNKVKDVCGDVEREFSEWEKQIELKGTEIWIKELLASPEKLAQLVLLRHRMECLRSLIVNHQPLLQRGLEVKEFNPTELQDSNELLLKRGERLDEKLNLSIACLGDAIDINIPVPDVLHSRFVGRINDYDESWWKLVIKAAEIHELAKRKDWEDLPRDEIVYLLCRIPSPLSPIATRDWNKECVRQVNTPLRIYEVGVEYDNEEYEKENSPVYCTLRAIARKRASLERHMEKSPNNMDESPNNMKFYFQDLFQLIVKVRRTERILNQIETIDGNMQESLAFLKSMRDWIADQSKKFKSDTTIDWETRIHRVLAS